MYMPEPSLSSKCLRVLLRVFHFLTRGNWDKKEKKEKKKKRKKRREMETEVLASWANQNHPNTNSQMNAQQISQNIPPVSLAFQCPETSLH